jgi:hypothetical protein
MNNTTIEGTFMAGDFGRLLFLFPVFWVLYVVGAALSRCPAMGLGCCLGGALMSPFFAVFPPILSIDDEEILHLSILLAAVAASIAWEFVSSRRSRR